MPAVGSAAVAWATLEEVAEFFGFADDGGYLKALQDEGPKIWDRVINNERSSS